MVRCSHITLRSLPSFFKESLSCICGRCPKDGEVLQEGNIILKPPMVPLKKWDREKA
jgi:hypothetical protein